MFWSWRFKCLVLFLASDLTWSQDINSICLKAKKILVQMLLQLCRQWCLKQLYYRLLSYLRPFLRPHLEYGCYLGPIHYQGQEIHGKVHASWQLNVGTLAMKNRLSMNCQHLRKGDCLLYKITHELFYFPSGVFLNRHNSYNVRSYSLSLHQPLPELILITFLCNSSVELTCFYLTLYISVELTWFLGCYCSIFVTFSGAV